MVNPVPTNDHAKIRAFGEEKNDKTRAYFNERDRLRKRTKLIKMLIRAGIPILVILILVIYFVFLR